MRTIAIALFTLAGCIDEFRGSNVQIDLAAPTPVQASAYGAAKAGELPNNIHFTLYAFDEVADEATGTIVSHLFEIQTFEIHRIIDLESPCFIDVGDRVPIPGLHASKYAEEIGKLHGIDDIANPPASATEEDKIDVATAIERQRFINMFAGEVGPKVVVSTSQGGYEPLAANCTATNGIPPPECVDEDSNQRRLDKCQAAWSDDPLLFEGTDRILTSPLNGTTYGFVLGMNPANLAPIGGAGFFVDEVVDDMEGFAIYWQYDDANNDGMPDYPASVPMADRTELGVLYLYGRAEKKVTRGVIHSHLISLESPSITADLSVFTNIGDDDVHF